MKKTKRKNRYKPKYSTKKKKRHAAGGMYADNTVAAAGQGVTGTTANIVFDQNNPAVLQQKMNFLADTKKTAMSESDAVVASIQQQDQIDQANITKAAQESKAKFAQGETLVKQGLDKGNKFASKLKELADYKNTLGAGEAAGQLAGGAGETAGWGIQMDPNQLTNQPMTTSLPVPAGGGTEFTGLTGGGGGGDYGMSSFSTGVTPPSIPPPVIPGATDAITQGTDAASKTFDLSQMTVDGVKTGGGGLKAGLAAYKAQRATNQAIKAGTLMQSSAGTAAGAGWKALSGSAKGGIIGTAATLAGEGLKKWGGDDDDTELNTAEWAGEGLSGIGTGIGIASTLGAIGSAAGIGAAWGSAVPGLGTAIGAVAGLGYGAYKALSGRKKARKAEADALAAKKKRVGKYNKKLVENLSSAELSATHGELEQKTYSGYDLGRNVVAKYGGRRFAKGGMKMGIPRYGYAS